MGIMRQFRQLHPMHRSTKSTFSSPTHNLVVGASSLDVAGLLALVANLLATGGLLGAVTRVVARLATVVAAHAVNALACCC